MDFQQRLQRAIQRGQNQRDNRNREARAKALSAEEFRRLHSEYRLKLSDHIENCVQQLPTHFPGFRYETIYGDRGWGAACFRDDIGPGDGGKRANYYSRLEMTIRPFSSYHVLDLTAKGTIRNKEIFSRNHFEELADVDPQHFIELIDVWVLEYVELYAAKS